MMMMMIDTKSGSPEFTAWQNSLANDSFKSLTGSRLSLMPFTESRYVESASGFHITGKLQCLRWMPTAEFPDIPLLL